MQSQIAWVAIVTMFCPAASPSEFEQEVDVIALDRDARVDETPVAGGPSAQERN
jgi:hypothetical protein